ncbi:ornithine decarboxylase antizyme-domain-containing protein [Aspergillus pseudoustus]|uniref:Ornithine decarboxylase antizyme-domain-containing protein n=1 Tax=Aspergillus pseudoustus TaxID=1810923 RepID=A0ABR4JXH1_9EURO
MARFMNDNSSTSINIHQFMDQEQKTTVLASCYSVDTTASVVDGFHYCTTMGAGSKTTYSSPPLEISLASTAGSSYPVGNLLEHKGEATHTIPGECERLFCDKLSAIFRGERRLFRQESLGIDASHHRSNGTGLDNGRIQRWIEVMDYTSDTIYRGFVTTSGGERTLFVFFEETALGHGLKSGLIALFELGSIPAFDCSQIVACVPRTQDGIEIEFTRNLGWCGFGLTTLKPWDTKCCLGDNPISTKWLFLSSEFGMAGTLLFQLAASFMFPKFLLPPSIFSNRRDAGESTNPSNLEAGRSTDKSSRHKLLNGHTSCIRCSSCAAHLCLTSQIISKGFTGRHGRAYLVSAQPTVNALTNLAETLPNTILQDPVSRNLVTGAHTVSDITCVSCGSVLGWKYIGAEEDSQKYKVGKFILETRKVMTTAAWDATTHGTDLRGYPATPAKSKGAITSRTTLDDVEFDSQDEDECEDLFSGIWTPNLAVRRRDRKLGRNPSSSVITPCS